MKSILSKEEVEKIIDYWIHHIGGHRKLVRNTEQAIIKHFEKEIDRLPKYIRKEYSEHFPEPSKFKVVDVDKLKSLFQER